MCVLCAFRYHLPILRNEWTYALVDGCIRLRSSSFQIDLFYGVLTGEYDENIYYSYHKDIKDLYRSLKDRIDDLEVLCFFNIWKVLEKLWWVFRFFFINLRIICWEVETLFLDMYRDNLHTESIIVCSVNPDNKTKIALRSQKLATTNGKVCRKVTIENVEVCSKVSGYHLENVQKKIIITRYSCNFRQYVLCILRHRTVTAASIVVTNEIKHVTKFPSQSYVS